MATLRRFEDIEAWKKARELTREGLPVFENWCFRTRFRLARSSMQGRGFCDVEYRRGI
jgi:hypothetical protein